MDCVILAGGRGIRLSPLTDDLPKPLLKFKGKAVIEYIVELLVEKFENIFIVVDYLGQKIQEYFGYHKYFHKLIFIQQNPEFKGTMGALLSVKGLVKADFLVICSDNLYGAKDIDTLLKKQNSFLIKKVTPELKDVSFKNAKTSLLKSPDCIYLEAGAWYLDIDFFTKTPILVKGTEEYGVPQTIFEDYKNNSSKYTIVFADYWYPVGTHWELNYVNNLF